MPPGCAGHFDRQMGDLRLCTECSYHICKTLVIIDNNHSSSPRDLRRRVTPGPGLPAGRGRSPGTVTGRAPRRPRRTPRSEDLNCDSLDPVELFIEVEQAFGVTLPDEPTGPVYKAVFTRQGFRLADLAEP